MKTPLAFALPLALATAGFAAEPPTTTSPATPAPETAPAPVGKRTFQVDAKKSHIVVQVFKDGAAAALAHDHVIEATAFAGTIVVDGADLATAVIDVTAQTASFVNDDPKLRKKYALEGELSEKDRQAVSDNMKSAEQLDVAHFPTVKFVSTSITSAAGKLTLKGKLTLHGVTKELTMPLDAKLDGDSASGTVSFRIKTSDYNIKPYSALLGAVKNKDEIILNIHLVGALAH